MQCGFNKIEPTLFLIGSMKLNEYLIEYFFDNVIHRELLSNILDRTIYSYRLHNTNPILLDSNTFCFQRYHSTYLQCYKTLCSRMTERKQVPLSDSAAIKTDRFNCNQRALKKSNCIAARDVYRVTLLSTRNFVIYRTFSVK